MTDQIIFNRGSASRRQFLIRSAGGLLGAGVTAFARAAVGQQRAAAPRHDAYGGVLELKGTRTGWFHVERIGGRWYFVTPEGHGFFSLGVTHAVDAVRRDALNLFQTRYASSEEQLSGFLLSRLRDWSFNSAGYGPLPPMEEKIPYVATIWTKGPRSLSAGEHSKNTDLFDPVVQQRLRKTVRNATVRHRGNPFCLGYLFIDLPIWHVRVGGRDRRGSYVDFMRSLPADAPGRRTYADCLRQLHHGNIRALQTAYGIRIASFDELSDADLSGASARNETVHADDEAFLNQIADVYYKCVTDELRAADPHHLVLGDRFLGGPNRTPDSILATAGRYVDVLSFQPTRVGDRQALFQPFIDQVTALTGRPVLLADVNTMIGRPAKDADDTSVYERESAEHTHEFYFDAAASKSCIGIHRCAFRDWQAWDPQSPRRGLLKADDSAYPILVEETKRTNEQVYRLVYGDGHG